MSNFLNVGYAIWVSDLVSLAHDIKFETPKICMCYIVAKLKLSISAQKASEYDQEIPQSHTADQTHATMRKSHRN